MLVTYFIFDFSFSRKLGLALLVMFYMAVFIPLQFAAHAFLLRGAQTGHPVLQLDGAHDLAGSAGAQPHLQAVGRAQGDLGGQAVILTRDQLERDALQQRGEVARRVVWRLVVIHDLAEKLDFAMAGTRGLGDLDARSGLGLQRALEVVGRATELPELGVGRAEVEVELGRATGEQLERLLPAIACAQRANHGEQQGDRRRSGQGAAFAQAKGVTLLTVSCMPPLGGAALASMD